MIRRSSTGTISITEAPSDHTTDGVNLEIDHNSVEWRVDMSSRQDVVGRAQTLADIEPLGLGFTQLLSTTSLMCRVSSSRILSCSSAMFCWTWAMAERCRERNPRNLGPVAFELEQTLLT